MSGRNGKNLKLLPAKSKDSQAVLPAGVQLFLTVAEVAVMLRCKPRTIYQMVHQKRIPFRKAGRQLLFAVSEIEAWTKSCADNQ
jgi:excisionase family DNA binding protein